MAKTISISTAPFERLLLDPQFLGVAAGIFAGAASKKLAFTNLRDIFGQVGEPNNIARLALDVAVLVLGILIALTQTGVLAAAGVGMAAISLVHAIDRALALAGVEVL